MCQIPKNQGIEIPPPLPPLLPSKVNLINKATLFTGTSPCTSTLGLPNCYHLSTAMKCQHLTCMRSQARVKLGQSLLSKGAKPLWASLQPLATHRVNTLYPKSIPIHTYVLFIPFFVFGFWSLLATKLRKYENIT